jgi:plastocyanin
VNNFKLLWTLAVLVAAVATLGGCGNAQPISPRPIVMQVQTGGKIFVRPHKGDVVQWIDANKQAFAVNFFIPGVSPCKEMGASLSTCTVDKAGVFPYSCVGCADPAVIVGSDVGPLNGTARRPQGSVINADGGYLYCDASSHAPKASPDPLPAAGGDTIQWFAAGSNIVSWNLVLQAGTCIETTINQDQPLCNVKADAPKTQTYSITADACTGTGSAVLTIR